jgi:hypothetical protein
MAQKVTVSIECESARDAQSVLASTNGDSATTIITAYVRNLSDEVRGRFHEGRASGYTPRDMMALLKRAIKSAEQLTFKELSNGKV